MQTALLCVVLSVAANVYVSMYWAEHLAAQADPPKPNDNSHLFTKKDGFAEEEDIVSFKKISVDEVRNYWDARPCNSGWNFDGIEKGTKEYWDEVTKRKYLVEYHIPVWAEFDRWKGKRVLEIGGGICTTATSFAKAGAHITIAELSPKSMEYCKQRFEVMGLTDRATFYVVNAEELSSVVPVEQFDLVWSFGVIHHSPNPEKIVAEIRKYMHQETVLKLMVYSKISFKLFWVLNHTNQWNFGKMDEVVAHYSEAREGSPVTYTYSQRGFHNLLSGFNVTFMGKAHIFPYQIEAYKQNRYAVDPLFSAISASRWEELEDELGWHLLGEAQLLPPGHEGGGGDPFHERFEGLRGVLPITSD